MELAEVELLDVEAGRGETAEKALADDTGEDMVAEVDEVAGEPGGFLLGDGDASFGGVGGVNAVE